MQQLQVAPQAVQDAPWGRSGYSWFVSRCEILLNIVLSSLTLMVMLLSLGNWMLLSLFHLEREPLANTPRHTCEMLCCLVFWLFHFYWPIHPLPALAIPNLPLARGQTHQGLKPSWWKAHLHVHLFRKTEENDSRFPSWKKSVVGIIKKQCAAPCLQVYLSPAMHTSGVLVRLPSTACWFYLIEPLSSAQIWGDATWRLI